MFGGDGSNDPGQFKTPGAYVSNFAPDITGIPADKALVAGWKKDNPGKACRLVRAADLRGVQVLLNAIKLACNAGPWHDRAPRRDPEREEGPDQELDPRREFRWSTKSNDPLNAKFYIFQIQSNGKYKLVG